MAFWNRRSPRPVTEPVVVAGDDAVLVRDAYERGRLDERERRRGGPLAVFLLGLFAVVGAGMLLAAALNGSFAGGGAAVDRTIATLTNRAEPAARAAASRTADETGKALQNSGKAIQERGDEIATGG